jgi:hypothetical protein
MSQGNSMCNYLKQAKISFVFTKSKKRMKEQVLSGEVDTSGNTRMWRNGVGG